MKFFLASALLAALSASSASAAEVNFQDTCPENIEVIETVTLADDANGDGKINPGDTVQYTISLDSKGEAVSAGDLKIVGPLLHLQQQTFVPGSCSYTNRSTRQQTACADDALNGDGLATPFDLKTGELHVVRFQAVIQDIGSIFTTEIVNSGLLDSADHSCPDQNFSVTAPLEFTPKVSLIKSVHLGHDVDCETKSADADDASLVDKLVQGTEGTAITYCYQITNVGGTHLDPSEVMDPDVIFTSHDPSEMMAPNESVFVSLKTTINGPLDVATNAEAMVKANPVFHTSNPIPGYEDVTDTSSAGTQTVLGDVGIDIQKTVLLGHWDKCITGREVESHFAGRELTYCYEVTNTGQKPLTDLKVDDVVLGFSASPQDLPSLLLPGDSFFVKFQTTLTMTATTPGTVTGTPAEEDGTAIPGASPLTDSDRATVQLFTKQALSGNCPPGGYVGQTGMKKL